MMLWQRGRQAQKTKQELENVKYDIIIRSPMHRAEQTADIINEDRNVEIIVDERLRERRLGEFEGHDVTEEMEKRIWNYDLNYQIPGGENLHDFEKRILDFFEDIKQKYADKTVLIVAHGGIAKVIKMHLYGMPKWQLHRHPASLPPDKSSLNPNWTGSPAG